MSNKHKEYFPELSNNQAKSVGTHVNIHSHVWIGDEVEIPNYMSIQAFCFIPNGVTFEEGVFLGPRVTFTNDKHPPSDKWSKTHVGRNATIGAGAIILPGVTIGANAVIGAGSVVTKDVPEGVTVVGNPAKPLDKIL